MKILLYVLLCLPAVIMPAIGYILSDAKKNSTMIHHHFASNFNIRKYQKKVMRLFTAAGLAFPVGGIMILNGKTGAGIAVMLITLIVFLTLFVIIQKKH